MGEGEGRERGINTADTATLERALDVAADGAHHELHARTPSSTRVRSVGEMFPICWRARWQMSTQRCFSVPTRPLAGGRDWGFTREIARPQGQPLTSSRHAPVLPSWAHLSASASVPHPLSPIPHPPSPILHPPSSLLPPSPHPPRAARRCPTTLSPHAAGGSAAPYNMFVVDVQAGAPRQCSFSAWLAGRPPVCSCINPLLRGVVGLQYILRTYIIAKCCNNLSGHACVVPRYRRVVWFPRRLLELLGPCRGTGSLAVRRTHPDPTMAGLVASVCSVCFAGGGPQRISSGGCVLTGVAFWA